MKKAAKILYAIFSIISVFMIFFGFYLFIANLGRDNVTSFIFLGVFIAGFLGLSFIASFRLYRNKHPKKIEYKEDKNQQFGEI